MAWTLCTSGSAVLKAGVNANSTIAVSGSALQNWSEEVESYICNVARVDVVTNYASLTSNGKSILGNLASSMIAQYIINYDIDAIGRSTAIAMLNILENNIRKNEALIKDDKIKTYLAAT